MAIAYTEYYVQLINKRTKMPINDDTGKFIVMTASSPVLATIYSDNKGTVPSLGVTSVANTMTDGIIQFWTATSVTSVDLTIQTAAGQAIFVSGLTPSQHRVEVDTQKTEQLLIFPYYNYIPTPYTSASITATASAWGNGLSIPANSITKDCFARTFTLGTSQVLNIGISGTPSGLLQAVTAAATGYHVCQRGLIASAGTATFYLGNLLCTITAFMDTPFANAAATALVFNTVTSTTLAAACGWVYLRYELLPV
jgi:hypothetical protein